MKLNALFALLSIVVSVSSCLQAEKVSLDTSGAEGLLLGGLSIQLGLFGGASGESSTCYSGGICKIAVTATAYDGFLDGVTGADQKCQVEFPGYKALLFSDTVGKSRNTATDWVLKTNTSYVRRSDGATIGTTNAAGVFDFDLVNSWSANSTEVWTGAQTNWTMATNATCENWSYQWDIVGAYGLTITTKNAALNYGTDWCNSARSLLCVEQ